MEFSQYVMEAIASVDYVAKDRDFNAVSLIKGAAEKAENETDSHVLDVISGSMTMTYKSKEQVFSPLFIEYGGSRSFGPEDLSEVDVDILRGVIQVTESSALRTRFSHIVWTITKEYGYGQRAVMGYLDAYKRTFDGDRSEVCGGTVSSHSDDFFPLSGRRYCTAASGDSDAEKAR